MQEQRVAVAPMMDWTDRHCRFFHRLLAPDALLYTEMITAAALHHGDAQRLLKFNDEESPVVLQLGGNDPGLMAEAAVRGEAAGYDAININVGCPSDRVQSGAFGACLMLEPDTVARCFVAMRDAVTIPVTVKSRIGVDDQDSDAFFARFIDTLIDAGCTHFDVHARIAMLQGLSPKQNREIPPLNPERVYRTKERCPDVTIVINGGIRDVDSACEHLRFVDGIMIGRAAYQDPFFLTELAQVLSGRQPPSREQIVQAMHTYALREVDGQHVQIKHITRHMLGLFAGQPGARRWRRLLSEQAHQRVADPDLLLDALHAMAKAA
ncbi:MAG: tRNA dihydrouridine(20/20a) synthase DusA [Pseudomonadota bacterium]